MESLSYQLFKGTTERLNNLLIFYERFTSIELDRLSESSVESIKDSPSLQHSKGT